MSLTSANRDLALLHPAMRERVGRLMVDIAAANLPLRVFEAWRSPERQRHLYAQGRTRPGRKVTFAEAWESYHQYGLAVDVVGFVDGAWTWDLPDSVWRRMHDLGAAHGLERLGFETPHLQLADLKIGDLMDGDWPDGSDPSWRNNMAAVIDRWDGQPSAPPMVGGELERPAIGTQIDGGLDWSRTQGVGSGDWHSFFGGQQWRYDDQGIYLRTGPNRPIRSPGTHYLPNHSRSLWATDLQGVLGA
ncbi:M15 family metallopeptidase [Ensifer sp. NBAIM29]|nr:M15 family metallopeptidase [Ensifer sp. NBAIM29]